MEPKGCTYFEEPVESLYTSGLDVKNSKLSTLIKKIYIYVYISGTEHSFMHKYLKDH